MKTGRFRVGGFRMWKLVSGVIAAALAGGFASMAFAAAEVQNGGFEATTVVGYTTPYGSLDTNGVLGWTFGPSGDVSYNGLAATSSLPGIAIQPLHGQVAFVEGSGRFSQIVSNFVEGAMSVSFVAAGRGDGSCLPGPIQVTLDSTVLTFAGVTSATPAKSTWQTFVTDPISVTEGTHTLTFYGLNPWNPSYDYMSVIDDVSIANVGAGDGKALGGTITTNGSHLVHTFTSSGVFMTPETLYCKILVVAGGGGGGYNYGGGGGAGGLIYSNSYPVSGVVTVMVGVGGASDCNGTNSSFGSLIAVGGGAGGYFSPGSTAPNHGWNGGSGGGGAIDFGLPPHNNAPGGTNEPGQGNMGGTGWQGADADHYLGAGGGGAGAAGETPDPNTTKSGDGGIGLQYSISGTPTYYAGGGGGSMQGSSGTNGFGGLGGGGAGALGGGQAGSPGTSGTGGGGGGGNHDCSGGAGGSGIVIVSYGLPVGSVILIR